ncbi:MAG: peptide deformylase [Gemmatimonadetes bacterium]|nr:peptide deformylase [Gemmatimonadota bacterium]
MIREVIQLGNPRLRMRCAAVEDAAAPQTAALVDDLRDTVRHWRATTSYGRAIAAPQLGVLRRVIYVDVEGGHPMVNPEIVEASVERMVVWDACLSFLAIFCQVVRHRWIVVRYQDLSGATREMRAEGDLSELLQHEIDHLDGILTVDRMVSAATLCTREEFEKRYRGDSPYATAGSPESAVSTEPVSQVPLGA